MQDREGGLAIGNRITCIRYHSRLRVHLFRSWPRVIHNHLQNPYLIPYTITSISGSWPSLWLWFTVLSNICQSNNSSIIKGLPFHIFLFDNVKGVFHYRRPYFKTTNIPNEIKISTTACRNLTGLSDIPVWLINTRLNLIKNHFPEYYIESSCDHAIGIGFVTRSCRNSPVAAPPTSTDKRDNLNSSHRTPRWIDIICTEAKLLSSFCLSISRIVCRRS